MNKVNAIVRRAAFELGLFLWALIAPLRALLRVLLGHFEWEPPSWGAWLAQTAAPLGRFVAARAAWVALALLVGLCGWLGASQLKQVSSGAWNEIAYWNSELVKEGDVVEGFTVSKIQSRKITVQQDGVVLEIEMP